MATLTPLGGPAMPPAPRRSLVDSEHVLLLKGLLLLAVVGFAFVGAWRHGLLHRVWREDMTGISVAITLVFLVATAYGSLCLWRLSRALNHLGDVQRAIDGDDRGRTTPLPDGCVSRYIRDLHTKAGLSKGRPIDQGLL